MGGVSGITKGKGKGKKGSGKGFGKQFQGYCNACSMWGHKAIDCKSQGKGKDSVRWYNGNKGKGPGKGGAKGFTKGKGKGMNNFEHSQRQWQTPPSPHDVLLLEQAMESDYHVQEKEQYIHGKKSKETKANKWRTPTMESTSQVDPSANQEQQEKVASTKTI